MSEIRDVTEAFMRAIDLLERIPDILGKENNLE